MESITFYQGPPSSTMNNKIYPNPSSAAMATTNTKPPSSKWLPFRSSILQVLPPGRYPLHQKASITPHIPQVALCPPEDQLLYSQVDEMERNFLDASILRKVMDINRATVKMVVSYNGVVTGAKGEMLHVLKNEFTGKRQEQMRSSLGDLMAMAYDMILVPAPLQTDKPSYLRGYLQDHNYCPPQQTQGPLPIQILSASSPTAHGAPVQNHRL